jgi:hypothetical protein
VVEESTSNDPVKLATRAYAYSLLGKTEEVNTIVEKLKILRNNNEKCWPSSACKLDTTSDVMYYLSRAGINRNNKVYNDGILWLQSRQATEDTANWYMLVESEEASECRVYIDGSLLRLVNLTSDDEFNFSFDYSLTQELEVNCTNDYCVTLYKNDGRFTRECNDYDELYELWLPSGCFFEPETTNCSTSASLKTLTLNGLDETTRSKGIDWIENHLIEGQIAGKRLNQTANILLNLYAYEITNHTSLKDWLLFSQSNEGSFGGDSLTTLEAIRVLGRNNENEWINDARKSILEGSTFGGWGNIILDSIAYDVFYNNNSITIEPSILVVNQDGLDFTLDGNLGEINSWSLYNNLNDLITVSFEPDYSKGQITYKGPEKSFNAGFLKIYRIIM